MRAESGRAVEPVWLKAVGEGLQGDRRGEGKGSQPTCVLLRQMTTTAQAKCCVHGIRGRMDPTSKRQASECVGGREGLLLCVHYSSLCSLRTKREILSLPDRWLTHTHTHTHQSDRTTTTCNQLGLPTNRARPSPTQPSLYRLPYRRPRRGYPMIYRLNPTHSPKQ
ncbi:hypothetical protein BU24DRAFT_156446 [Aaosphaeria arxii CBS 175.79]|uniref:Uncharacterized protein n=1 Tax=Aaosphaeria arxii CBS 175.79 TaxID=1450172 RepID=A0A6A5XYG5_9PLEO|nr:uncharacterized protein BU24DRAFT_156446 [Aaosphaeria arxii CBS 175.79]KAF2017700.1 hypothetical protein BU24DRAFT_156446 [Aaosphaeria arxii CBS 175.79]